MKKLALAIILFALSLSSFAQGDRRGFQGSVNSMVKETLRAGGKDEAKVNTAIQFTGRGIVIEGETYEIVKKTFDGKNKTTFTCTKRRGTFEITFTAGESIEVVDTSNSEIKTVYKSLTEK